MVTGCPIRLSTSPKAFGQRKHAAAFRKPACAGLITLNETIHRPGPRSRGDAEFSELELAACLEKIRFRTRNRTNRYWQARAPDRHCAYAPGQKTTNHIGINSLHPALNVFYTGVTGRCQDEILCTGNNMKSETITVHGDRSPDPTTEAAAICQAGSCAFDSTRHDDGLLGGGLPGIHHTHRQLRKIWSEPS